MIFKKAISVLLYDCCLNLISNNIRKNLFKNNLTPADYVDEMNKLLKKIRDFEFSRKFDDALSIRIKLQELERDFNKFKDYALDITYTYHYTYHHINNIPDGFEFVSVDFNMGICLKNI